MSEPTAADMAKARELCVGSIHGERGAIECRCAAIAQALADAREAGAKEASDAGFKQAMTWLREQADEWRGGASSIKGHHLPLKHVYRWLARMEES